MLALPSDFPLTHVLHLGAGTGSDTYQYAAAGLDPIVLVEADPEAIAGLTLLARQFPAVQVVKAAVAGRSGAAEFHRSNFPDLSSLSAPTEALTQLFPGARTLSRDPVQALSPADVLRQCKLPGDGAGLLVIETPGEALGILRALAEAGMLQQFPMLRLQEGLQPLYEGAPGLEDLQAGIQGFGYRTTMESDPQDPDRPYLVARFQGGKTQSGQDLQALTAALQNSQDETEVLQARLETAEEDLQILRAQQAILVAEQPALQARLQEMTDKYEAEQQAGLALQRDLEALQAREAEQQQVLQVQQARAEEQQQTLLAQQARAEEQQQTLLAQQARAEEQQQTLLAQKVRAEELEQTALTQQARVEELEQALQAQKTHTEEQQQEVKRAWAMSRDFEAQVATLKEQQQEHAVAKQTDLEELQQRRDHSQRDLRRAEGQIELIKDLLLRGDIL